MGSDLYNSRYHLLNWVNQLCSLNLTNVEQCASGAAHLQVMDALFPTAIPMHKVKWDAKYEYEYIANFKLLQMCFEKCNIAKHIEVDRLVKGRYQDNFEFLQWMKSFFDAEIHRRGGSASIDNYDGAARRQLAKCAMPSWAQIKSKSSSSAGIPIRQKPLKHIGSKADATGGNKDDSAGEFPPMRGQYVKDRITGNVLLTHELKKSTFDTTPLKSVVNTDVWGIGAGQATGTQTTAKKLEEINNLKQNQATALPENAHLDASGYGQTGYNGHGISGMQDDVENQPQVGAHFPAVNTPQGGSSFYQSADTLKIIREQNETIKELRATIETLNTQFNLEHAHLDELQKQYDDCNVERETLVVEKDFFYNKLRKLEIMCEDEVSLPSAVILDVLYASDDLVTDLEDEENADRNAEVA